MHPQTAPSTPHAAKRSRKPRYSTCKPIPLYDRVRICQHIFDGLSNEEIMQSETATNAQLNNIRRTLAKGRKESLDAAIKAYAVELAEAPPAPEPQALVVHSNADRMERAEEILPLSANAKLREAVREFKANVPQDLAREELRIRFACAVLPGLSGFDNTWDEIAKMAWKCADAMLEFRQ